MRIQNSIKLKSLHCQLFTCNSSQKNTIVICMDVQLILELVDVYNLNGDRLCSSPIYTPFKEIRAGDKIPDGVLAKLSGC